MALHSLTVVVSVMACVNSANFCLPWVYCNTLENHFGIPLGEDDLILAEVSGFYVASKPAE
jgi:hypothetical protein